MDKGRWKSLHWGKNWSSREIIFIVSVISVVLSFRWYKTREWNTDCNTINNKVNILEIFNLW